MVTTAEENLAELRAQWHAALPHERPALEAKAEIVKVAVARAQAWREAGAVARAERESAQAERAFQVGTYWTTERIRAVMAEVRNA